MTETLTINEALERFVARCKAHDRKNTELVTKLLRSYLDGYGHNLLSAADRSSSWDRYNQDDEVGSFCNHFGPQYILEGLDRFLGWFVIRKVMLRVEDAALIGPVMLDLSTWLVGEGNVDPGAADDAMRRATAAGRELPEAERLSELLYWSGKSLEREDILEYVDWEGEEAEISRVEDGKLWFRSELGEVGPVKVPQPASELAKVGWAVTALGLGRTPICWFILEMGSVYPR